MTGLDQALAGATAWIVDNLLVDTVRVALPGTGDPVLDEESGELEYPAGAILYEGPGAVLPASNPPTVVIPDANLPWPDETRSSYRLMTPLDAPVPPKDALVTVTAAHSPVSAALLGRAWRCSDPGLAGTVSAVRITPLDQMRQTG
ncbi:DUF6093 family protein [Streptomyces sp. DH12]|uniref:DUF6093 family protein n=1 Tax=Streptomyces sp. DH12 TaxID=2857010 RepID=UPI001E3F3849|nr:DUF6093 family protein [Streptomyces sp. DH12]